MLSMGRLYSDKAFPPQRLRLPAVTRAAIRDSFNSPAHLAKPECRPLPEGFICKGVAYWAMSQFLTLGANDNTLECFFMVIRVYYRKLGHMLKLLVPKFRPYLSARLKYIAEKQVPAKLKPIVVTNVDTLHAAHATC